MLKQNIEIQLPNFLFSQRIKRTTISMWFKYALIRSISIDGIRDGIYPTKYFDSIAVKLGVSKRTVERYFKELSENGFAIHFKHGYKIISKLKSQRLNVRIPVEQFKDFSKGEIFVRELIDQAIERKRYLTQASPKNTSLKKTLNGSSISTNSSHAISLFELELSSGYDKSTLSKSIKSLEKKSNLNVIRQRCLNENGFTWNKVNEYSFQPVRKESLNTARKKPKINDWFQSLVEERKETLIILNCISDYYSKRKVPYTHYNAILNRIIKKRLAFDLLPQSHWNEIGVKDKREWFTKERYQYFFLTENGSLIVNQYVQTPKQIEEFRIELANQLGYKYYDMKVL